MSFYFVCNTILGILGGSAYLTKEYLDNPISESEELLVDGKRNWMRDSVYAKTIILVTKFLSILPYIEFLASVLFTLRKLPIPSFPR